MNYRRHCLIAWSVAWVVACLSLSKASGGEPCRIEVIDSSNGWPVPLVELTTTHGVRFVSDNAGVIAFDLPELMDVETWFHVRGHGYRVAKDGFGFTGVRLTPQAGARLTVQVQRELAAKRLGRITGGGLFAESQKLGDALDWQEQRILGCDSVQNVIHRSKLFWSWGDTTLPGYPLGRFHMIGATTPVNPLTFFEPPLRLRYDYFVGADDVPRNIAEMPGDGPTWLNGFASLPDQSGRDRLVATYAKIEPPLSEYERGLCVWNEETHHFEKYMVLWHRSDSQPSPPLAPHGHAVHWMDDAKVEWILFGDPFPSLRCKATFEDWANPKAWQELNPQSLVTAKEASETIVPHRGAIAWNAYRNRWVTVFTQLGGESSELGEIWYAESESPNGPWRDAIHVVTHDNYTFYNPQIHSSFTQPDSPVLLFEATYTHAFSKTTTPTPRHDYNQVLYRLDLDELAIDGPR